MLEDAGFDTTTTWDVTDLTRCSECDFFHLLIVGDHPPQMDAEAILKDLRGKDVSANATASQRSTTICYCYNDARVIKWLWKQAKNRFQGGAKSFED